MSQVWAFLDESGDLNLSTGGGATTHFAIAAVVAADEDLRRLRQDLGGVRKRHFQTGEIKSKSVGRNHRRRLDVLEAIGACGCRFLGLVVDKRRLRKDSGLQYRQSFYKYINRFVYERLFRAHRGLKIRADQHGRPDFMASFKSYIDEAFPQRSLEVIAPEPTIEFVDSATEILVQVADFIAGTLRHAYSTQDLEQARELLGAVGVGSLGIQDWPPTVRTRSALPSGRGDDNTDSLVRSAAERAAYTALEQLEDGRDDASAMQIEVIQELLQALRGAGGARRTADGLAEMLRDRGFADVTRDHVRRSIIGPLRDRGVLIVSSDKGYSLPDGMAGLETHMQRMEDEVRPILRRVQAMTKKVELFSVGKVDPLGAKRFSYLRALLEQHELTEAQLDARPDD